MTDQINDGGPAFPTDDFVRFPSGGGKSVRTGGMSLRDWFAGQALSGMLANDTREGSWAAYAVDAYAFADAMLAKRSKNQRATCHGTGTVIDEGE